VLKENILNISELVSKRANELASLLESKKEGFDFGTAMDTIRQATGNIDLSDSSRTMLRNAAIGAGTGGTLGLMSSRPGYRTGDVMRGAVAGGLLGAGGTAAYQAAQGKAPMFEDQSSAPISTSSGSGGGLLSPITSRPISATLLAATGAKSLGETVFDRHGGGRALRNPLTSPFSTDFFLPHVPGTQNKIRLIDKIKGYLGDENYHNSRVAEKIKNNVRSWVTSLDGDHNKETRAALSTFSNHLSDKQLLDISKMLAEKNVDHVALQQYLDGLIPSGMDNSTVKAMQSFTPNKLENYLGGRSPLSVRNRRLGVAGLVGGAAVEPLLWGTASAMRAGDQSKTRLTADQINSINERYFR